MKRVGPDRAPRPATDLAALTRSRLPNGVEVAVLPVPHVRSATISVHVRVGSRFETPKTNGMSHFLEHMLFRGTARYPTAFDLNFAIEDLGGTLSAVTHVDSTVFQITLPPASVERALTLIAEMFLEPRFGDLGVEKRIIEEEILEDLDEDGRDVDIENASRKFIFGDHPLGSTITGSVARVARFTEQGIRAHLERHYVGANIVVAIAGAVDPSAASRSVRRCFGRLRRGRRSRARAARAVPRRDRLHIVASGASQTELRLSYVTFGSRDPRRAALQLLLRILDDGMTTRLTRRVIDERGLAYNVFAGIDPYHDASVFDVGAAVSHDTLVELVTTTLGVLEELRSGAITERELEKTKRRYGFELDLTADDAGALAAFIGANLLQGTEPSLARLRTRVEQTTARELERLARAIFRSDRRYLTCVGHVPVRTAASLRARLASD